MFSRPDLGASLRLPGKSRKPLGTEEDKNESDLEAKPKWLAGDSGPAGGGAGVCRLGGGPGGRRRHGRLFPGHAPEKSPGGAGGLFPAIPLAVREL